MSAAGVPRLRWIGRLLVGLIVGLTVLAVILDARPGSDGRAPWEARLVAVAAIDLVWLLELTGVSLPRPLFVAAVGLPVAWLNVAEDGAVSILFLLLAVGWAAYTASESASRAGLGIGLGAALSYLINVDPEGWLAFSTGLVLTWLFVCGLLRQQQLRVEQERLVAELRAAQADLARQAQASERRRIAREIHDVAAHTLSVTMLQLTGVRLLLQRTGGTLGRSRRWRKPSASGDRGWTTCAGLWGCSGTALPRPRARRCLAVATSNDSSPSTTP